jgi:hypothetical protein
VHADHDDEAIGLDEVNRSIAANGGLRRLGKRLNGDDGLLFAATLRDIGLERG